MGKVAEQVQVRWATRLDVAQAASIDCDEQEFPWLEDEFRRALRRRDVILLVAVAYGAVQGYCLFQKDESGAHIHRLAVRRLFRRLGIGTALVNAVKRKADRVTVEVPETYLGAQLFFRACGFRAFKVVRRGFITGEDTYLFEWP